MSKKDIYKDQLLAEDQFVHFCNDNYTGGGRRLDVTPEFLEASKKDGLIIPLLSEGSSEEGAGGKALDYYSPHQILIMIGLRNNVIRNGRLASKKPMAWAAVPTRTILWGDQFGYTVNADSGESLGLPNSLDIPKIASSFHSFLALLHTQPQTREFDKISHHRERHFNMAPKLQYDWSSLKNTPELLKRHKLNINKLNLLRRLIGTLATELDPLEYWFYYIRRHPQWRKDNMKGDALLAQELYVIQDVIVDVLEIVSGNSQPPLLEFLHQDSSIKPFLIPLIEFVEGVDVIVLEETVLAFEKWLEKPANKRLAPDTIHSEIEYFKVELQDYKVRYGAKSYKNGMHEVDYQTNYKLGDLDTQTRNHVKALMSSYDNTYTDKRGTRHFVTSFGKELVAQNISHEDKVEYDREWRFQSEVNLSIEHRLVDLQRQLWAILNQPDEVLRVNEDNAWALAQEVSKTSSDKQAYLKARKTADSWAKQRDELGKIIKMRDLVYCKRCRKNPVQQRYAQGDQQITTEPICDTCFVEAPALRQINETPWRCGNCGKLIYKFANQNMLDDTLMGGSTATITLEFGRLEIKAKCKSCKQVNQRFVDWGWQP